MPHPSQNDHFRSMRGQRQNREMASHQRARRSVTSHMSEPEPEANDTHQPWRAIIVSTAIMVFGAIFLIVSASAPTSSLSAESAPISPRTHASAAPHLPLQASNTSTALATRPSQNAVPKEMASISSPSTLADATLSAPSPHDAIDSPGLASSAAKISETTSPKKVRVNVPADEEDWPFLPRLKPRTLMTASAAPKKSANKNINGYDPLATHPLNLVPLTDNINPVATPVFFFTDELQKRTISETAHVNIAAAMTDGDLPRTAKEVELKLGKGETFVDMLARVGISRQDRNEAASAISKVINLRTLRPGFTVKATIIEPHQTHFQDEFHSGPKTFSLLGLKTRPEVSKEIIIRRGVNNQLTTQTRQIKTTRRLQAVSGRIDGNLYVSMRKQGAPDTIIDTLANVFAYDVDFQRDIFKGDQFEAIYEAIYDDQGTLIDGGRILFGRLSWRGNRKDKGYYFFNPQTDTIRADYFDQSGQSARRLLMKTPIDGARLSSSFGPRRHPILGYRKTHKGVDFAARRGTPIKATGDGIIERANRYGSFGNYIRIRHNNGYKTAYAHLKGFARGIRKGRRVRQGDIIGYVGTTGRSTGPHLHYEVHHKGKAVNPQKLKIATGTKLSGKHYQSFKALTDKIDALRLNSNTKAGAKVAVAASAMAAQ